MLKTGSGIQNRAEAMAAAGSDARMNGCEMPVIINSGSGNQGITCSVPVVVYAEDLESCVTEQKLPVREKLHFRFMPESWDMRCMSMDSSSGMGTGW